MFTAFGMTHSNQDMYQYWSGVEPVKGRRVRKHLYKYIDMGFEHDRYERLLRLTHLEPRENLNHNANVRPWSCINHLPAAWALSSTNIKDHVALMPYHS